MTLSPTERLLAIGIDSQTAADLQSKGWTAGKLARASTAKLDTLGITEDVRAMLKRPPIPAEILFQILHRSKRTCCVCRNPILPIIIHHIDEWHSSRDHAESNLVVLCLNDHGNAHSKGTLSQNLTPHLLRKHKEEWEKQVREADGRTVLGLSHVEGANWDYVNLTRVFRLANQLDIERKAISRFSTLRQMQMLSAAGDIDAKVYSPPKPAASLYLCGLTEGHLLYQYTTDVLEHIIQTLGIVDISAARSFSEIRAIAEDGTLVFVQAPFYFRQGTKQQSGPGQIRTGYTNIAGVKIEFAFDAYESTSMSARVMRLTGRKVESVIGLVSGSDSTHSPVTLQISCLGIGSFFRQIHSRPAPAIAAARQ